jgi:hypothetical protein
VKVVDGVVKASDVVVVDVVVEVAEGVVKGVVTLTSELTLMLVMLTAEEFWYAKPK